MLNIEQAKYIIGRYHKGCDFCHSKGKDVKLKLPSTLTMKKKSFKYSN